MGQISVTAGPCRVVPDDGAQSPAGLVAAPSGGAGSGGTALAGVAALSRDVRFTSASGRVRRSGAGPTASAELRTGRCLRDVHLSDGAHFENLALYELVRRHCRYVLVSDCGADPRSPSTTSAMPAPDSRGLRRRHRDRVSPLRSRRQRLLGAARRGRHHSLLANRPGHPALRQADDDRRRADRRAAIHDAQHGVPAREHRRSVLRRSAVGVVPPARPACGRLHVRFRQARGQQQAQRRLGVRRSESPLGPDAGRPRAERGRDDPALWRTRSRAA